VFLPGSCGESMVFARLRLFLRVERRGTTVAPVLRKPDEAALSPARWRFVWVLWNYHEAAGRPTLDVIASTLQTVPPKWLTARSVLRALCHMSSIDPAKQVSYHFGDDLSSPEEDLREVWGKALDDPLRGKPAPRRPNLADPWNEAPF